MAPAPFTSDTRFDHDVAESTTTTPTVAQPSRWKFRRLFHPKSWPSVSTPKSLTKSLLSKVAGKSTHSYSSDQLAIMLQRQFDEEDRRLAAERAELVAAAAAEKQRVFNCGMCMGTLPEELIARIEPCGHSFCMECVRELNVSRIESRRFPLLCPTCTAAREPGNSQPVSIGKVTRDLVLNIGTVQEQYERCQLMEMEKAEFLVLLQCRRCGQSGHVDKEGFNEARNLRCPVEGCGYVWCKRCQQEVVPNGPEHSCDDSGSSAQKPLLKRDWTFGFSWKSLILRAVSYVSSFSLFMILAGFVLHRSADYALLYYFALRCTLVVLSKHFVFIHTLYYVAWPSLLRSADSGSSRALSAQSGQLVNSTRRLFECGICMEEMPDDSIARPDPCGHVFCRECLRGHVTARLDEHRFPILCPTCTAGKGKGKETTGEISQSLALDLGLNEEQYRIWTEMELASFSVVLYCRKCKQAMFVDRDEHEKAKIINCPLPGCNHAWCKQCQQSIDDYGPKHSCNGTSELDHLMKEQGWKYCPTCKTPIQKISGCDHMSCMTPACNTHFCYICGGLLVRSTLRQEIKEAISAHFRNNCAVPN